MKRLFTLFLFVTSINAFSQSSPEEIINTFFDKYENAGSNEALDYIFSTNPWMDDSKDQIDNIKTQLTGSTKLMGQYHGYEKIASTSIGENLVLHTFLIRYNRQPLRFSILMFKPNDKWRLQNFSFDDDLDTELEEAARAYRLKENLPDIY